MLRFEHPDLLWLLLLIPALAAGFVGVRLWNRRLLKRFVALETLGALAPGRSRFKRATKDGLVLLSLGCLILAMANPQVGTRIEEIKREGIDLFVALDVSLSMRSEDIKPSRLEKAKRDISALLRKLSGDRVGLIVFAGDAFVQFPLTADYSAADLFISTVDVESVPTPGTMIGSAIEKALESFTKDLPTQKAVIVVSDGENTEGDVQGAAEKAKEAGVKVYTVGMGTLEGGPIPVPGSNGGTDYKRDGSGTVVVTKLDESVLRQLASVTSGNYHRATSGGNEIDDVFSELSRLQKTEFGAKQVTGYESRYQIPLGLAILLLLLELFVSERRGALLAAVKRMLPETARRAAVLLVWIFGTGSLLAVVGMPAEAQTVRGHVNTGNKLYQKGKYADAEADYRKALAQDPKSGVVQFNLGDAHYKQDRYDEAVRSYAGSTLNAASATDKAAGFYNMGNAFFKANRLPEAVEAYKQSLRYNPDDDDVRHNLEVARRRLQEQQKQQQQQQKNQQQNKQDQQKQQQDQQKQDQKDQQNKQQQQNQQQDQQQAKQDQTRDAQRRNQMPKDEAERILEALKNNEKDLQKKLQQRPAVRVRVEKDW